MEYFVKITPTEKGCSVETVQNAEPGLMESDLFNCKGEC